MGPERGKIVNVGALLLLCLVLMNEAAAQEPSVRSTAHEFGPVVSSYLDYLREQQEVVDDRVSRREIDAAYYRRNSNRIRALRQMAVQIARETDNDYLPELEAVAPDELKTLFEERPKLESLKVGQTLDYKFRFLGFVNVGREKFYLFARLDPYEQAELRKKAETQSSSGAHSSFTHSSGKASERERRINIP